MSLSVKPFIPTDRNNQSELHTAAETSYTFSNQGEQNYELPVCNENRTGINGSSSFEFE